MLSPMSSPVLSLIVNHLWQSTVFAAALGLLTLMLRSNGAHVRYWLWLAASVNFLVPFSLFAALGARFAPSAPPAGLVEWYGAMERIAEPLPAATSWTTALAAVLAGLWACGFVTVLAHRRRQGSALRAMLRGAEPGPALPVDHTRMLPVKYAREPVEPGLVGIYNPVLLLPQGINERLTKSELDAIVAHELCHLRRNDNLTASVHIVVEALLWFHPLVWWIGARLVEERERACDEAVLRCGHDSSTYAEGLLNVCEHYVARSLASAAGVSGADLKKRITAILRSGTMNELNIAKKCLLAAAAAAALFVPVIAGFLANGTSGVALAQNEEEEVLLPIVRVAPVYPTQAAAQRLEGHVIVEYTITETGTVTDVEVFESSDEIFERPALDSASRFRYEPRIVDGSAVAVPGVRYRFDFVLED